MLRVKFKQTNEHNFEHRQEDKSMDNAFLNGLQEKYTGKREENMILKEQKTQKMRNQVLREQQVRSPFKSDI